MCIWPAWRIDERVDVQARQPPSPRSPPGLFQVLRRLRGHTSYIKQVDWSADNRLLRSCCGSYELLHWDVGAGRQHVSTQDALEADTAWATSTCILGFPIMGIWPPHADGSDVNAVDVLPGKGLVATGDDQGYVNLFNYPCVARHAPRRDYGGHSSHVTVVRFMPGGGGGGTEASVFRRVPAGAGAGLDMAPDRLVSVGGNDGSAALWRIVPAAAAATARRR